MCTIRLFTTNSVEKALKEASSLQEEIEIYSINNSNMVVGQTGQEKNCKDLKPLLQKYRSSSFVDAYFIYYNPKRTSLVSVKTPTIPNGNEEVTLEDSLSTSVSSVENETKNITRDFLDSLKYRGTIGAVFNSYSTDKTTDTLALEANTDISKRFDWGVVSSNFAFLYDFSDDRRRYLIVNELYAKYYMDESVIQVGRSVNTWGLLEGFSMSDVFNTKNYLSDSFDTSNKYGAFNVEYTKLLDDDKLSIIVKAEEVRQPYPATENVYNFYNYNDSLETEEGENRPSVYLKYSGIGGEDDYQSDYSVILQHGYDNKRDIIVSATSGEVTQVAYLVNKAIAYASISYGNAIYKVEAAYTDVLDYSSISDYLHYGVGVEYVPSVSVGGAELRLLTEYYQYIYFEQGKNEDVDLSEMFQNDIFVGAQSSFGDAGSSEIKGGVLYDIDNGEQAYALTFGTRMKESYRLSMEWKVFVPGDDPTTAISRMGQFNQATFRANYFF